MKYSTVLIIYLFTLGQQLAGQISIESHMMGHSLIDHASSTDQTKIAYWIDQLADEAGRTYEMTGQFGSIWQFADFNPESNWGIPGVDRSWDGENETFGQASLNNFLFTIFNFVQDVPSHQPYPSEGSSVLYESQRLVDSVDNYQPMADIYLYENWPDMAGFTTDPFNPTANEYALYNSYTTGAFHNWWLALQDSLLISHPSKNVRMIPAGPMISQLMMDAPYDTIPVIDLYEDNAPHGTPTIYFLAGLATYMAFYEEQPPLTYTVPVTVHPTIRSNYSNIVTNFWNYLQAFNNGSGSSRVFLSSTPPPNDADSDGVPDATDNCPAVANADQADYDNDGVGDLCDTPESKVIIEQGSLYHDNAEGILMKGRDDNCYLLYINSAGTFITEKRPCPQ